MIPMYYLAFFGLICVHITKPMWKHVKTKFPHLHIAHQQLSQKKQHELHILTQRVCHMIVEQSSRYTLPAKNKK